jgi:hypothetical protein
VFSVTLRTQVVGDALHYHITLSARCADRDRLCGIITLHGMDEWVDFLKICEAFHMPIINESPLPSPQPETAEVG